MAVMLKNLASALDITATGAQAAILLNTSPFQGGRSHNALLKLQAAVGGSGVVKLQGSTNDPHTTPGTSDPSWTDLVSLTSASPLQQEIVLPQWIRVNVTTVGTGTLTANLEGIQ